MYRGIAHDKILESKRLHLFRNYLGQHFRPTDSFVRYVVDDQSHAAGWHHLLPCHSHVTYVTRAFIIHTLVILIIAGVRLFFSDQKSDPYDLIRDPTIINFWQHNKPYIFCTLMFGKKEN